jgi:hypothetical protein
MPIALIKVVKFVPLSRAREERGLLTDRNYFNKKFLDILPRVCYNNIIIILKGIIYE